MVFSELSSADWILVRSLNFVFIMALFIFCVEESSVHLLYFFVYIDRLFIITKCHSHQLLKKESLVFTIRTIEARKNWQTIKLWSLLIIHISMLNSKKKTTCWDRIGDSWKAKTQRSHLCDKSSSILRTQHSSTKLRYLALNIVSTFTRPNFTKNVKKEENLKNR